MLNVTLTSATGKKYLLSGTDTQSPVLAPMGALVELIGQASRTDQVVPARAGALAGRTRWGVLEKDVELYLHAETGEELDSLDAELRSGLHVWAPDRAVPPKPATFEIETNNPQGPFFLDVWLSRPLPGQAVDLRTQTSTTITAGIFSQRGLFRTAPRKGTGTVRVENHGDEMVYPRLEGVGAGGVVTGPSGAKWQWPSTGQPVAVNLDPQALKLAGVFPEGVPPGGTGVYSVPAGVTLTYELLFASPW